MRGDLGFHFIWTLTRGGIAVRAGPSLCQLELGQLCSSQIHLPPLLCSFCCIDQVWREPSGGVDLRAHRGPRVLDLFSDLFLFFSFLRAGTHDLAYLRAERRLGLSTALGLFALLSCQIGMHAVPSDLFVTL